MRYFESRAGRGKFVKLQTLQPDKRFIDDLAPQQVFKVGSRVYFGKPKVYGVIKWIGNIDGCDGEHVIVETVSCTYVYTVHIVLAIGDL